MDEHDIDFEEQPPMPMARDCIPMGKKQESDDILAGSNQMKLVMNFSRYSKSL